MTTDTMDPMVFDNMMDLTDEADAWTGDYGNDSVKGMGGDDTLTGDAGAGQDSDGASDDFINGNMGDDEVNGGQGNDTLRGGADDDMVSGGAGNDSIHGDLGDDTLMGDGGADWLHGGDGHDSVEGGAGNDTLIGGMGHDRLDGGAGNDMIYGNMGNDLLLGGGGADTIMGHMGNDSIEAGPGSDVVNGNQGMDTIMGGGGGDTLRGGRDNDMVDGDGGDDMIFGDRGSDTLDGGAGADTIYGDNMTGSPDHEGDMIVGGMEVNWDELTEQHLALVEGMTGNKIVYGDELYGGVGNDTIHAGDDDDMDGSQNGMFTFQYPSGGQSASVMFVHGNMLDGGAGDDSLTGAGGQDTLKGGAGDDTLIGGGEIDQLMGGTGDDSLSDGGAIGGNLLKGDGGDDMLSAAYRNLVDAPEVVSGTDVADTLAGGAADTLMGGAGADTFMVNGVEGDLTANAPDDTEDDGSTAITVLTSGTAGLVMDGGSGSDVFDFSNLGGEGTNIATPTADGRTFIQIDGFSIGNDRVHIDLGALADGDADGEVDEFTTFKNLLDTEAANATEAAPELDSIANAAGNMAQVGNDTFVSLGGNVVLKFIGISATQIAADEVFFEV